MNNKKIGIVTIKDYNYGNRLQNYALQQAIRDMGGEPESIYFEDISKTYYLSKTNNPMRRLIKLFIPTAIIRKKRAGDHKPAKEIFDKFTEKYVQSKTVEIKRHREIEQAVNCNEYRCFIAGSDQIWNPKFAGDDYFFLPFAKDEQKYSYGASIGFGDVPERLRGKWANFWKSFEKITVREETAEKIIYSLIGKKSEVVLDPTLLVEKKEWDKLSEQADIPIEIKDTMNENYTFMFFIGDVPEEAQRYKGAEKNKIIDISDEKSELRQKIGPIEFVRLVRDSHMVLTDSYHCLVFSIIFQKKYKVFDRNTDGLKSMNSRMEELYKVTGLDNDMIYGTYNDVKGKLNVKRMKSLEILRQMIS